MITILSPFYQRKIREKTVKISRKPAEYIIIEDMLQMRVKKWMGILCLLGSMQAWGASFTSSDNIFTLDLPAGWKQIQNETDQSVLTLQKNTAHIDIKKISCQTEDCLEDKIHEDLAEVKAKKMTVITNTYTGEEIKQIEFSTGEPLYYISFFNSRNDFSAGYFLIDEHAYSLLAKNITYAEADLLFSFFSPVRQIAEPTPTSLTSPLEMDDSSPRAYTIAALPQVEETVLDTPLEQEQDIVTQQAPTPVQRQPIALKQLLTKLTNLKEKFHIHSLVSANMPPYIQQLGRLFDIVFLLVGLFLIVWITALILRIFVRNKDNNQPINPNSLYPIKLTRLYGTPAIIFRAKDNQGNILVSLGKRWHSICMFIGMFFTIGTLFALGCFSVLEQMQWIHLSSLKVHFVYSAGMLFLPAGILLLLAGLVWNMFVKRKFSIFDHRGEKAALVLQKGFHWKKECYEIYFVRSKNILYATRNRFSLRRNWTLTDEEKNQLARVTEMSLSRAIIRKCLGHLWGFLRADYTIEGPMDSQGYLQNQHTLFNALQCNINKPEALSARDGLVLATLISMRDMDKWYPWFE